MIEMIENYSLLFAIGIFIAGVIVWNVVAWIYFKYFDSDKKRIARLNKDRE